jgi:hypothetical protein
MDCGRFFSIISAGAPAAARAMGSDAAQKALPQAIAAARTIAVFAPEEADACRFAGVSFIKEPLAGFPFLIFVTGPVNTIPSQ